MTGVAAGSGDGTAVRGGGAAAGEGLAFRLLGPLGITGPRPGAALGGPLERAFLAVLLLRAGRRCGPEELVDGLWGAGHPASALGAVRTYAWRVRRALGDAQELLRSDHGGYRLDVAPDAVDALRFERLRAEAGEDLAAGRVTAARDGYAGALALWRGEALAGVAGPFAERERERLAELRLDGQVALLRCRDDLGEHAGAAADLAVLIGEHPLREDLRALRMLALHRDGRVAEALAEFTGAREVLREELGTEPGPELVAAQARVLAGGPAGPAGPAAERGPSPDAASPGTARHRRLLAAVPPQRPAARPYPAGRPGQLPPSAADFTGRRELRGELRQALRHDPDRMPLVVLTGIGGVGKTALALDAAHAVRSDYADGQLYVDLRGAGTGPVDPMDVLADFLVALGLAPGQVPATLQARAAAYRSALAERRVLVVLDNAAHAGQLEPLLPGAPGSAALVTSRSRVLTMAGARRFEVGVPDTGEAVAMLDRFAGPGRLAGHPDTAEELVRSCGLLPLALRIIGSRLAAYPDRDPTAMVTRLRDHTRTLSELRVGGLSVEATIGLGYAALPADQARALRLCALLDCADFPASAVGALLGLPEREAEWLLEPLVDAGLLESHGVGRYRFHDLVRLYARQRAEAEDGPEARADALLRLLDFLIATLRQALYRGDRAAGGNRAAGGVRAVLWPTEHTGLVFGRPTEARAWLLDEHLLLSSTVARILRDVPPVRGLPLVVCALNGLGISGLFVGTAYWNRLERLSALAVTAALGAGIPPELTAEALSDRAGYAWVSKDYATAERYAREAVEWAARVGNEEVRYLGSHMRAAALVELGRGAEAREVARLAADAGGDPRQVGSPAWYAKEIVHLYSYFTSEKAPVDAAARIQRTMRGLADGGAGLRREAEAGVGVETGAERV
ncbi:BTAD domain-containing putative transcriptional regulator [Kitasatospora sp. NPDC056783]|uniref:AfsR/SARP family transcriptional regulator n=1 Tax=Kitasatospora sp. NPDC056783 TaxID=3345943 RepID=UPI0036B48E8A